MHARAARRYRQVDVESAPKSGVMTKLFRRCLRDLDDAAQAIVDGDIGLRAKSIDHAFRIIAELDTALDTKSSPDLCANLSALYEFVLSELSDAILNPGPRPIANARAIVENIADSFRLAEEAR